MQFISIYRKTPKNNSGTIAKNSTVVCRSEHLRNSLFLERENEEKFKVLRYVYDCALSILTTISDILELIEDIKIVLKESKHDIEITNHLKEIIFMCKLCIWNIDEFFWK